jgi:hemoglobin/transferrin/lactoferrin receptor protein
MISVLDFVNSAPVRERIGRTNYVLSCVLAVAGCVAVNLQSAVAQSAGAQSNPAPKAKQEAAAKPSDGINVVVTASRGTEQDPLSVPQSITNITRSQLDQIEYPSVDEIIRQEPNISGAPAEGNPNYWQQGFSIRGLGAQRVLTLSDGVRQAGQGIGYGGGNLSLYDPFSIERIEILRGPASVLYGTDSFGGVVNIIRRQPRERTEFGYNGGTRYVYDGAANVNRGGFYLDVGDKDYGILAGGSYINSDRPNLPDGEDANSGSFRNAAGWARASFKIDDDTQFRVLGDLNRTSDILVLDSVLPLPIAVFGRPGNSSLIVSPFNFSIPKYQRSLLGAEMEWNNLTGDWDSFKTGVYWQQLRRNFNRQSPFYPIGSPGFAGPPTFVNQAATVTSSIVETDDTVNMIEWQNQARLIAGAHTFTFGFDLGHDSTDLPETETQVVLARAGVGRLPIPSVSTIDRVRAKADQLRLGLYTQDSIESGEFTFVPGVRLDYFTVNDDISGFDDDELGVSASFATLMKVTEQDSLFSNVALGYRAPDLGERFQNGVVNLGAPSRVIGKEDLDSERALSAEFGAKGNQSGFRYEAATFYNHIRDYIGARNLGFVDGFVTDQFDNLGIVNLYGIEGRVGYDLTENVELFTTVGRTYTAQSEKIDVPNWSYRYGVGYKGTVDSSYIKRINGTLYARSVANSVDNTQSGGRAKFPSDQGFTVLNLEFSIGFGKTDFGDLMLVSGLRNITDKKYREAFFNEYQPGRNAYVGLQLDF